MTFIRWLKIFIFLEVYFFTCFNCYSVSNSEAVCNTDICKEAAQQILDSIDKTQDPCNDFYQYACGGYIAKHPVPEDKSAFGTFDEVSVKAMDQLKEVLEAVDPNDSHETLNGKTMYKYCMKKQDNVQLLKKYVENLGGWPILCNKNLRVESISFENILAEVARKGSSSIVAPYVDVDLKNATKNVLQVDQADVLLGRENILDPVQYKDLIDAYKTLIRDAVSIMGSSCSQNDISQDIAKMIDFETKLSNLTSPSDDRRNYTQLYNMMTINDLQKKTDPDLKIFNWFTYFNTLVKINFAKSEPIVVSELAYLKSALQLIKSTEKRTVVNYIVWSFIMRFIWHAGGKLQDANFKFEKIQFGIMKEEPRWLSCAVGVDSKWGFAVGWPYSVKYFPKDNKAEAETMIENIHQAFSNRLDNVTFLDKPTKKIAKEKSAAMVPLIGYPDWISNNTAQQAYYIDFPNMTSSHLDNIIGTVTAVAVQQFKLLRKPVDKNWFYMTPATVNAMYSSSSNSITFPAAILQSPFYKAGRPLSMNYGAIGAIVGHEITHGFDDQGSQFDKDGSLKKWWPESVTKKFIKDTQCFIDQYSQYCPPELSNSDKLCLNGILTQGENIADSGGVEEAFLAYKTWLAANGPEAKLPGLEDYTSEQLFFLSYAHVWCSSATEEDISNGILYDPHSLPRYRVIGPLSNSIEFANTFTCPVGPMNRGAKSCKLW